MIRGGEDQRETRERERDRVRVRVREDVGTGISSRLTVGSDRR